MAEVLASEQEGKVPASQEMTSRISGLLDRLDAHCDESRLQISNRALKLKQMLTEDGEYATVLDVLVGLETAVEGTEVTDCTQVLAMLGTTW